MKKIIVLVLAVIILSISPMAFAAQEEQTNTVADVIFLKPIGAVATVFGSVLYVISWPVAKMSGGTETTYRILVQEPYEYTFKRPVGEIGTGF